jgi:four helix bundle protein
MLKSYRELKVWKKSYNLCVKIYRITKGFPLEERYVLTSQIRRSALSIPSNIAEGYGRKTKPDYIRILYIAYGSVCELDTQILLAGDLKYLQTNVQDDFNQDISEVEIMLKALIRSLEKRHIT